MNVKCIGAFKSGLIRQVVFERRGLKIQEPLYYNGVAIFFFYRCDVDSSYDLRIFVRTSDLSNHADYNSIFNLQHL